MEAEAVQGVRGLDQTESFRSAIKVSSLKTQLNLVNLLLRLPEALEEIEKQQEQMEQKKQQWLKSQESDFSTQRAAAGKAEEERR